MFNIPRICLTPDTLFCSFKLLVTSTFAGFGFIPSLETLKPSMTTSSQAKAQILTLIFGLAMLSLSKTQFTSSWCCYNIEKGLLCCQYTIWQSLAENPLEQNTLNCWKTAPEVFILIGKTFHWPSPIGVVDAVIHKNWHPNSSGNNLLSSLRSLLSNFWSRFDWYLISNINSKEINYLFDQSNLRATSIPTVCKRALQPSTKEYPLM